MDEGMLKLLGGLQGESLQDTIKLFVNLLLRTNPIYQEEIPCRVEAGAVYVTVGVEKSATLKLSEFGVDLEKLDKKNPMCRLVRWENINPETELIDCVKGFESTAIRILSMYILAIAEKGQKIEELSLKTHAHIEEYVDNSEIFYQERIRLSMVSAYKLHGYLTPDEMKRKKLEFFNNTDKMSEDHSLLVREPKLVRALINRLQFNVREYLASVRSKKISNEIELNLDVWAMCLDHTLRHSDFGEYYNFSLELQSNERGVWKDIILSLWVKDKSKREATARLCKYSDTIRNVSFFVSHPEGCRDRGSYYTHYEDDGSMPKHLLNVKKWVFEAITLFEDMLVIAQQYIPVGLGDKGSIREEILVLFIMSLGAFQFKDYIKSKYGVVNDSLFMHCPTGFWRPFNKKYDIVKMWQRDFFENGAVALGLQVLKGADRANTDSKLAFMHTVRKQSIEDCLPLLFKRLKRDLSYSISKTEALIGVFSLIRHLCNKEDDRPFDVSIDITPLVNPCLGYINMVMSYLRKNRADLQDDMYGDNPFHMSTVFIGFIHAAGAFSGYPALMAKVYEAFEYTQLNLCTDIVLDAGTFMFPLTRSEKASAMELIRYKLAADGPARESKVVMVFKSGHSIAEISQWIFNKVRGVWHGGYTVNVMPGSRKMTIA